MVKWRDRTCDVCGTTMFTASKASTCLPCQKQQKKELDIASEAERIAEWGFAIISGPTLDKFSHRCYVLKTPCGHEWDVPFTNFIKQVKNSKSKNLRMPCGVCGPKHRMATALQGFMEKYARDYDLSQYEDYRKLVRGLSEVVYKKSKDVLNPNGYVRGRTSGYHLDHIIPIIECFKQGWPVEKAAGVENLQLLPWQDNLSKGAKVDG